MEQIIQEIAAERAYQKQRWGNAFDDKNTLNDWVSYIGQYAGQASKIGTPPPTQREQMLKVAALAVAALEAFDRNDGFAKRHYD